MMAATSLKDPGPDEMFTHTHIHTHTRAPLYKKPVAREEPQAMVSIKLGLVTA